MNRIFRLVWSHRLNALVVVSEIATARGSLAAGPVVVHLKVPMSVLSLGLSLALCTGSAWAGENQTLTDLQALTAKYTAPLPVKLDAEVALAAAARDRGTAPLLSVDAKVNLNLGTPMANRPALQVQAAAQANADLPRRVAAPGAQVAALADLGIAAGTGNGAGLDAHANVDAVAAVAPTAATVRVPLTADARLTAAADTALAVNAEAKAAASVAVAATPSPRKAALEANVDAAAQARLAAAEGEARAALIADATVTPDAPDAVQASLASNVAGGVRVDALGHVVDAADRNPKLVDAGVSAVQTSSMALAPNGMGNALGGVLNGVGGAVGGLLDGVGTTVGTLTTPVLGAVGAITTPILGTVFPAPTALPPGSPKAPAPADPNAGLVIGTGGLVGSLSQLVGPTAQGLLGGDGYVRNGNLAVSSANVMQTYSVTNVLGVPVVNLTPVGTLLDGLGGASTGGSSHLTLIGGVTSDSYIYNINNGDPNGLLGLVLPDGSPAWSNQCVNLLVASVDCWAVNAAQDYQVLVGDGAYANGSREVVIGANARHELPQQDANVAFPGAGVNDPTDPTGVPTADYAARMGHSVVVGDSATGTANGQTILGSEATSNQANSVALGYRSAANRGAQASYSAYGLTAAQVSAGEVSVGFVGGERQISNVAAGSAATDAVNVAQLQGAISQIDAVGTLAVTYDDDGAGGADYRRVTLGGGTGTTTIANLANGAVDAGSTEAVNGAQLFDTNSAIVDYFGGVTAYDPATGAWTAPSFQISTISSGGAVAQGVYDNASDAFSAVDGSLVNLNTQITDIRNGVGSRYLKINSTGADAAAAGLDSIAVGTGASATAANSIAVGAGAVADREGTVSVGAAGAERQVVNVAAGTQATDAVNLGQLFNANQAVATHLGGGAALDANGLVTAPSYTINNVASDGQVTPGSYDNVGSAFDAVSTSLANVADQTDTVDRLAVKYDADASGDATNTITLAGDASGAAVALTNLADGRVLAGSLDAVNGNQLFQTNAALVGYFGGTTNFDGNTGIWTAPTFRISSIATNGSVIANDYSDVTAAFSAVDTSLTNLNTRIDQIQPGGTSQYVQVNSTKGAATAGGADSIAIGPLASAAGSGSAAIGDGANASADNSVALGAGSVASVGAQTGYTGAYGQAGASNSVGEVAVGSTGAERKVTHVADGSERYDAVNVGQLQNGVNYAITESKAYTDTQINNINNGTSGMFQVNNTQNLAAPAATGDNAVAGGAGAAAAGSNATALGNGASAQGSNSVALGAGSVANRANTVSVGSSGAERQIANVADGSEATDAVNVRQLQASQQGTIRYDTNVNGTTNLNSVTLGSTASGPTTVRNVAPGTAGTDAVNVDQLRSGMAQTLDWSKAYTDERMDSFDRNLQKTDNRASAGVASAMAVAALPQPYEAGRSMASLAAGSFNGESGVAVGISGVSEGGRWIYKFSGSTNSRGDGGVAVGAGIQW
ncbi:YadA-like family protein [Stenotrophomonas sp. JAI102]|uniref:YadA-like family protein n=1 Tax=Stenotrophomonas sp. JAI102 TaxID=2723077 RepID=UPI0015CB2CB3|nr:YadA-like family protein [Stenotrophomonas sp. JAI102]NYF34945.1 autotransporter adhesin [Stenotrophomonas sp. JAI102]